MSYYPAERDIIRRAFELWERAGCPERKDKDLCRQAVKELREEENRKYRLFLPLRPPDNL
jgi:hypothetical protein